MYAKFFGLTQEPFSIAPDPRYLFMSERHREALAHLLYGVRGGGGFVLLTGEIGAGKTTVCRCFLEQIPKRCNVAYIFNPKLTVIELLKTICDEFRIAHPAHPPAGGAETVKQYLDPLNEFLLRMHAVGQNNVLIIDEAQNLSAEVLEQLRLLTNLETNERKLLQIILIGQPELRDMLARPELEQLAQRVIARFHLEALSAEETAQYLQHRLSVAGLSGPLPFSDAVCRRIHQLSRGVPRRINLLCDRALLGAYAQGEHHVSGATLSRAAGEVFGPATVSSLPASPRRLGWALGAVSVLAVLASAGLYVGATRLKAPASGAAAQAAVPASASPAASAASAALAAAAASHVPVMDPAAGISLALRSESDAWRELAALWKLDASRLDRHTDDPCQALKSPTLQCFKSDDGLALLRLLERPAVLTLRHADGKPAYVTLVSLGSQSATVRAAGRTQTVSLLALARQWRGEFATLWRTPPNYQGHITPGPVLEWLDTQLARAAGETPPAAEPHARRYDARLQAKVAAFQRSQGMKADGLAGPITLMLLSRAAGIDEPRLLPDAAAAHAMNGK
jgi:general secretion pathway protein A